MLIMHIMQVIQVLLVVIAAIAPFIVLINFFMISSLLKKTRRFELILTKYENREQSRLETLAMEAMSLLRSGRTDEARKIADRIVTS